MRKYQTACQSKLRNGPPANSRDTWARRRRLAASTGPARGRAWPRVGL